MINLNHTVDQACRLVHEVREMSGYYNWKKTLNTLKDHYFAGEWRSVMARDLIRRNVREARQQIAEVNDTHAVELATDALLVETLASFMREKRECQHPRKQRQNDEYYCPACGKRWEALGE